MHNPVNFIAGLNRVWQLEDVFDGNSINLSNSHALLNNLFSPLFIVNIFDSIFEGTKNSTPTSESESFGLATLNLWFCILRPREYIEMNHGSWTINDSLS